MVDFKRISNFQTIQSHARKFHKKTTTEFMELFKAKLEKGHLQVKKDIISHNENDDPLYVPDNETPQLL